MDVKTFAQLLQYQLDSVREKAVNGTKFTLSPTNMPNSPDEPLTFEYAIAMMIGQIHEVNAIIDKTQKTQVTPKMTVDNTSTKSTTGSNSGSHQGGGGGGFVNNKFNRANKPPPINTDLVIHILEETGLTASNQGSPLLNYDRINQILEQYHIVSPIENPFDTPTENSEKSDDEVWENDFTPFDELYWFLHRQNKVPSGGDYLPEILFVLLQSLPENVDDTWVAACYYAAMNPNIYNLIGKVTTNTVELSQDALNDVVTRLLPKRSGMSEFLTGSGRLDPSLGEQQLLRMRAAALLVVGRLHQMYQEHSAAS